MKGFGVKESNVIFVLFSVGNVNREFTDNYWDRNTNSAIKVKDRTSPEHLSFIFPLFRNSDPYYFKYDEKFDKKNPIEFTDDQILEAARENIVTPLEHIVSLIVNAS